MSTIMHAPAAMIEMHLRVVVRTVICLSFRREWDSYVVPVDHPDGSPVPHSWVLPDSPSDQAWASAMHTADTE